MSSFLESVSSPMQWGALLLGVVCLAFGSYLFRRYQQRQNSTLRLEGSVVAIERLSSRVQGKLFSREQVSYQPWVDFSYKGKTWPLVGNSADLLLLSIGRKVPVRLVPSPDGQKCVAVVGKDYSWIFSVKLLFNSTFFLVYGGLYGTPLQVLCSGAILALLIGYAVAEMKGNGNSALEFEAPPPRSSNSDAVLITTPAELARELAEKARSSMKICAVFGLFGVGSLVAGLICLPHSMLDHLTSNPVEFVQFMWTGTLQVSWGLSASLWGVGCVCLAIGGLGLLSNRRRLNELVRDDVSHLPVR